jgi:predicted lysophospholipase L1 biosynthesis ABC-type transport system permease subunit
MKTSIIILGVSALIFALADLIHGQHNGDVHRFYIHVAELVAFFGFLSLLEIQAFRLMKKKFELERWLACFYVSTVSFLVGFTLFALAGGSAHGDGGPLAVSFAIAGFFGAIGLPISIIGFLVVLLMRRRRGTLS